ncbi:MAG TPA: DNA-3-methyladenine glycosylase I [Prolixibacteraceae bacterium]|nr:DNA-3-methyladenine glycosylase I [Prolixibacteraceae bacterium]
MNTRKRCPWAEHSDLYRAYHDEEWGVPVTDDRKLFEFLILESAQAGLSWITILKKREAYRRAFDGFDPSKIACYDTAKMEALMQDPGIIRNRRKIEASIQNARAFLDIQSGFGSFSNFIWRFTGGSPIVNHYTSMREIPDRTPLSIEIASELKRRGFCFLGPTIVYAHMQATGMVNDHLTECFRHKELSV